MWHDVLYGLFLGYGAAVPIGPMNLELIRRNLNLGTKAGLAFGLGACLVDFTMIVLVGVGAMVLLEDQAILRVVGVIGALILFWFGCQALCSRPSTKAEAGNSLKKSYLRHIGDSYVLTLLNPYTLIFWSSVGSQAALLMSKSAYAFWWIAPSVLVATISWVVGLNTVLKFTRHKISARVMRGFNIVGGLILIGFGGYGLWHVFL